MSPDVPVWPGLVTAALVGLVYLTLASGGTFHFRQSSYPHHVLVADAWLHGQLHVREEALHELSGPFYQRQRAMLERRYAAQGATLTEKQWGQIRARLKPPALHDWSQIGGKYYGYWAPMPSVLLVPLVAFWGVQVSDVLLSCLLGAGTVLLTYLMLREGHRRDCFPLTTGASVALAVLLGLGTVHFYLTVMGQVWFLSQIVATFFLTLAIWCVLRADLDWRWVLAAGVAFGLSYLSRNSELITAPFFACAIYAAGQTAVSGKRGHTIRLALAFCVPLLLACGVMLAFNHARFGSVFEDGVRIQLRSGANPLFTRDYKEHGIFSLYYLPRNVYYYFLNPMLRRLPGSGTISFDPWGNSTFLVTPALLYVFRSYRHRDWLVTGAWLGTGAGLAMLLLFFGTGWFNFGNRYLLDLMPLAIVLVASGMDGRLTRVSASLIALSVMVNTWGWYRFSSEQF